MPRKIKKKISPKRILPDRFPESKSMDYFVIEKGENIKKKLETFMKRLEFDHSRLFIFDIHKTTLTKEGDINESVLRTITELLRADYQVIFLSYVGRITGTPERIRETLGQINSEPSYRSIPKFFMKKRKKQRFMKSLHELLSEEEIYIGMTLVDDNPRNIRDVDNLRDRNFSAVHFTGEIDMRSLL